MMNMNKVFTDFSEVGKKVESAHYTVMPMVSNTGGTSFWVALVCVDHNPLSCAFNILLDLIWESKLPSAELCTGEYIG